MKQSILLYSILLVISSVSIGLGQVTIEAVDFVREATIVDVPHELLEERRLKDFVKHLVKEADEEKKEEAKKKKTRNVKDVSHEWEQLNK